jgi:hypothetical protein
MRFIDSAIDSAIFIWLIIFCMFIIFFYCSYSIFLFIPLILQRLFILFIYNILRLPVIIKRDRRIFYRNIVDLNSPCPRFSVKCRNHIIILISNIVLIVLVLAVLLRAFLSIYNFFYQIFSYTYIYPLSFLILS